MAQVQVPGGAATVPGAPATTPAAVPGFPTPTTPTINPAVPRATPPSAVGRTFQTPPGLSGLPAERRFGDPANPPFVLGVPPVVASGAPLTNAGLASPFSTNVGGFVGTEGLEAGPSGTIPNIAPPIANPAGNPVTVGGNPVAVDLPPGTVVRPAPTPGVVGGTLPPASERFQNRFGTGAASGAERGTATSPNVVRPQR
jgi:hypothetical protein